MKEWPTVRLRDVSTLITKGTTPTTLGYSFTSAGINFVKSECLTWDGRLDRSKFVFVDEATNQALKRSILAEGDVLFSMAGVYIGKTAVVPKEILPANTNQAVGIIRLDRAKAEPRFIDFVLRNKTYNSFVNNLVAQSAQPNLNLAEIGNLPVPLPPLAEQRAIAGVLGALDDKMELNRRMNETLEAIAKAEFRRMMEEGGETGTLGDIAENPKRAVDPSEIDAQTPYIGLEHMPRRSIALGEWGTAGDLESGKARFHRGEILFGKLRPYFHKVGVAPLDGVCSTDILTIVPKKPAWFGLVLGHLSSKELIDHTDACSTGTKMPRASWSDIARYEIALPPEPVAAKLTGMIQPLVERIIANIHESQTLAGLRDALLPKLLSGAVRVRAEERAEMVAANRVSSESARQAQHDSVKRPA